MSNTDDTSVNGETTPSRTRIKLEMEALQKLGMRLTQLNPEQLALIPMDETLARAIHEYQRLKKNEAKRRQSQYIGRIMRNLDSQPITDALNELDAGQARHVQHFHSIEQWRERLLLDTRALTDFFTAYPEADKQQLRQLIDKTRKEQEQHKNLGSSRKLFRFIKAVIEATRHV